MGLIKMKRTKSDRSVLKSTKWSPLKKGDIVDIVAPGWACSREQLALAVQTLKSWGLVPRVPKDLIGKTFQLSNKDEIRFQHLKKALLAKDSKAIWCLRGGYGSLRLMPMLDKLRAPAQRKLLIGYSDITTIHMFLNFFWGWPSLHGPLFDRLGREDQSAPDVRMLKDVLFGKTDEVVLSGLKPVNSSARRAGAVRGSVVGGNPTVIQSGLGTPWQVSAQGKILFFEEVGERPYRIDRILTQMEQAGFFRGVKAVIFADMLLGDKKERKKIFSDVIKRFADSQKFPVFVGLKSGHGKLNFPVPLYTKAQIKGLKLYIQTGI